MRCALWICALSLILLSVGCSEDAEPSRAGDRLDYELFPSTILLDEAALGALTTNGDDGELVFDPEPAALAGVEPGRVIVAGASPTTPSGLLRVVTAVNHQGSELRLSTLNAPVQLAFRRLKVDLAPRTVSFGDYAGQALPVTPLAAGGESEKLVLSDPVFDGDKDLSTTDDQVIGTGTLEGGFDYVFGVQTDWGAVTDLPDAVKDCLKNLISGSSCSLQDLMPEVVVGYSVSGNVGAELTLSGAAYKQYSRPYELLSIGTPPLEPIPIGILVFFPKIVVTAEISGKASSEFAVGMTAKAGFEAGISWSNKSGKQGETIPKLDKEFSATLADVTLYANGRVSLDAGVELKLYGFAGPRAGLTLFAELDADQARTPCYELSAGLEASYGFVVGADLPVIGMVSLASFDDAIPLAEAVVDSGACTVPAGNPPGPPGSGPSNETLLNPTFTPWSRTLATPFDLYVPVNEDGLSFTELRRTIDGRFVVTSTESHALSKIDEQGNLIWSNRYEMFEQTELFFDPSLLKMRTVRAIETLDAGLLLVTYPYGLIKIGQGGDVAWGESFEWPRRASTGPYGAYSSQQSFTDVVADVSGTHTLVGTWQADDTANSEGWLLRVDHHGAVISSKALSDPNGHVYPSLLLAFGGDYLIAGMLWNGNDQEGFVARVDAAGAVQWAKRYGGCDAAPELVFTAGIVHSSGDALLVGRDGSPQRGFVMRLKPDGTLGYFTSPWTGTNLEDVALHSVAELPTGGLLVAGRYVPYTPNDNVLLAMLDAVGQPLWAKIFRPGPLGTLPAPDAHFASLRLTDDGGVMLAAISNQPQPGDGSIWAMKLPAKDGQMTFTGSPESADLVLQDNGCMTGELPWAVDVHDLPVPEPTIRSVTVTPAALDVASQGG